MTSNLVRLQVVRDYVRIPTRDLTTHVAYNLYSAEHGYIFPNSMASIKTGIAFQFRYGFYGRLIPSVPVTNEQVFLNGGIIENYKELIINLVNFNTEPFFYYEGKCLARMIVEKYHPSVLEVIPHTSSPSFTVIE